MTDSIVETPVPQSPERRRFGSDKTFVDRFWQKVKKGGVDDCWIWKPSAKNGGYGSILTPIGIVKAHRLSYVIHYGIFDWSLHVLHVCDNPACVNPKHLFIGTAKDNMQDKIRKGRANYPAGEKHSRALLTETQIRLIRQDRRSQKEIASAYGISQPHVSLIKSRKIWAHVRDVAP